MYSLRRADHSSRGVLPTVVRRCVWSRKPQNWGHNPRWVVAPQKQKYVFEEFYGTEATYDFEGSQIEEETMVWFFQI